MGDMEEALALAWHSSGHIGYLEENQQREDLCLSLFLFMFAFQINNNKFFKMFLKERRWEEDTIILEFYPWTLCNLFCVY